MLVVISLLHTRFDSTQDSLKRLKIEREKKILIPYSIRHKIGHIYRRLKPQAQVHKLHRSSTGDGQFCEWYKF